VLSEKWREIGMGASISMAQKHLSALSLLPLMGPLIGAFKLNRKESAMLSWSLTFLIIALIAAVFGFGGIAGTAAGIAKILFFVFLVLLIVSAVAGALRGKKPM